VHRGAHRAEKEKGTILLQYTQCTVRGPTPGNASSRTEEEWVAALLQTGQAEGRPFFDFCGAGDARGIGSA